MRKYGTPEPIRPVAEQHEPDADPQGIDVTATRRQTEHHDFDTVDIINEGEESER